MAQHGSGGQDLPATWPFRLAGTLIIAALVWFCLHFAIKDVGEPPKGFGLVFWGLILVSLALIIGGALVNWGRERKRRAASH
jgi:hypothetical protein